MSKANNYYNTYELKISCHYRNERKLKQEINNFINQSNIEIIKMNVNKELNEIIFNYEFKILEKYKNNLDKLIDSLDTLKVTNFELKKLIDSKNEEFDL